MNLYAVDGRVEVVNATSGNEDMAALKHFGSILDRNSLKRIAIQAIHLCEDSAQNWVGCAQAVKAKLLFLVAGILVTTDGFTQRLIRAAEQSDSVAEFAFGTDLNFRFKRPGVDIQSSQENEGGQKVLHSLFPQSPAAAFAPAVNICDSEFFKSVFVAIGSHGDIAFAKIGS